MDETQLIAFLKENLSIEVKTDSYGDDDQYLVVRLMLKNEQISVSEVPIK